MKALFIHDHPFIKNIKTDKLFTSGNLNSELWDRYLKHFDFLSVIGRCKKEEDTSRYNLAEKKRVTFNLFYEVKGGADYFKKRKLIERKLIKEIRAHDVIILRFPATISIFAAQYCIKNNIPYVAEVVGCSWDCTWNYGGIGPKLIAPYSFFEMKKSIKKALATIYVTEFFLQNRYSTNAKIITHASNVILDNIDPLALKNRISKINTTAVSNTIHLGIIGNIAVKYKGYDVLLAAVNKLPNEIKNKIKISIVGGGDPSYLKSIIDSHNLKPNVNILGKLKAGEEIFKFIDSLDLYIHPSKQEGLPRVVIEAMSRACPILASSVAGTPELIDNEFIHEPGDAFKLSKDILKVVNNKSILKKVAKINFENSKRYLFENLENKREIFFKEILKNIEEQNEFR